LLACLSLEITPGSEPPGCQTKRFYVGAKAAFSHTIRMAEGRLIRVTSHGTQPQKSVSYIVAEVDKAEAMLIILKNVGSADDDVADLGRVSEQLINAMGLTRGHFVPVSSASTINPKI
jgi:hypothetical protein